MAKEPAGIVFDIQRGAVHDGPGLRTSVFLKGCPLRCIWCHNPESQEFAPQTGRSGKRYGRLMSVSDVMQTVLLDRDYYEISGGGVTLSGGEPTAQYSFCLALLKSLRSEGIHACLDTCGHVATSRLLALAPFVDLFHFDYKATGEDSHRSWTGVTNRLILHNLSELRKAGCRIHLRCPIIPGLNDTPAHLAKLDEFDQADPPFHGVDRLPYHTTGETKYVDLGRPAPDWPGKPKAEGNR